jgi:hypothetical protein
MSRVGVRAVLIGLGWLFPLAVLISGITLWPLAGLLGSDPLLGLVAIALGLWVGGTRYLSSTQALALGDVAVLFGLVAFLAGGTNISTAFLSPLWTLAALAWLFGWAAVAVSVVRILGALRRA